MADFDTLRIRAGYNSADHNYAVNVPIYQTASFDLGSIERAKSLWSFEEAAGIYLSGHPLDSYTELWQQNVSARSTDFLTDPETGSARVRDGARVTIGGLITERTLKTTRTNQTMAFVTIEDLVGSVETLVFPRDFEKYRDQLVPDAKIFMQGRVSLGDGDDAGKLICERIRPFIQTETVLWIRYPDRAAYDADVVYLMQDLGGSEGEDKVSVYLQKERQIKHFGDNWRVHADPALVSAIRSRLGNENVQTVTKPLK